MAARNEITIDEAIRRLDYQKAFDSLAAPLQDANPDGSTFPSCTTGFTVHKANNPSTQGFSTAGHCNPEIDAYRHDNLVTHSIEFKEKHIGVYGDYAWYRAPGTPKYDDIYSDWYQNEDITRVMATSEFQVDDHFCFFGRKTGRHCDYVYKENMVHTFSEDGETFTVYGLIAMDFHLTDGGDSGGPWFLNDGSAVGIHHGFKTINGFERALFSIAAEMERILPVRIMTCCGP